MTSTSENYDAFFNLAFGQKRFDYQWNVANDPKMPDLINVPTGAGKTTASSASASHALLTTTARIDVQHMSLFRR